MVNSLVVAIPCDELHPHVFHYLESLQIMKTDKFVDVFAPLCMSDQPPSNK